MSTLAETSNGQLRIQGNEIIIDAKDADASKFRVGSRHVPGQSGGGGGISFDLIDRVEEGSPRKEVIVLVGGFNGKEGELGICVWNGKEPFGDATQIKVMEIRGSEIEFKVPVKGLRVAGGNNQTLVSPNGKYVAAIQDDGNLVVYDTDPDNNPSTPWWSAVWSWFTGKIGG